MIDFPPVFILAGGLGTRVSSIHPDVPKAMVPINGEPFIAHQLRLLAREGVRQVVLCVGYLCQPLVDYVGSGKSFGLSVRYSYDGEKPLGTGGAIRKACQNLDVAFAVLYGDSYLDIAFQPILASFFRSGKLALMTVFKNENHWIPSNIVCKSGLVSRYDKDQTNSEMQYVDYGLSIFQPQTFKMFRLTNLLILQKSFRI